MKDPDAVDLNVIGDGDGQIFDSIDKAGLDHVGHLGLDGDAEAGRLDLQLLRVGGVLSHEGASLADGGVEGLVEGLEGVLGGAVLIEDAAQLDLLDLRRLAAVLLLLDQLGREKTAIQRLVMLRHGCGLSTRSIAQLTELSQGQARSELRRFEARCRRRLSGAERSRAESLIARQAKRLLARRGPGTPHPAQLYRAFEAEAAGAQGAGQRVSRVVGLLLTAVMALICRLVPR